MYNEIVKLIIKLVRSALTCLPPNRTLCLYYRPYNSPTQAVLSVIHFFVKVHIFRVIKIRNRKAGGENTNMRN